MNTADPFPIVYIALRRDCDLVRRRLATWTVVADDALFSVDAAWQHEVDVARACRQPRPDPAKYVIVSGAMKPDVDKRGAHLVIADWQHTYDPQGFYEEVERERQEVEQERPITRQSTSCLDKHGVCREIAEEISKLVGVPSSLKACIEDILDRVGRR